MNFFKKDYNKPGPGVPKNAPRKKGFARFFEIVGRDMGDLIKTNLFVALCCLPSQAFLAALLVSLVFGQGGLALVFAVLALLASLLAVPAFTAQAYIISKRLRDDPGFVFEDFKKVFLESFKPSILASVLYALITGSQVITIFLTSGSQEPVGLVTFVIFLFSSLLFGMILPYVFLQKAYVDLGTAAIVKNGLFLALGNAPKSIVALLLHLLFSGQLLIVAGFLIPDLLLLILPIWLLYTLFLGHALPNLLSYMWTWPIINKTFEIEETLKERQKEKLSHIDSEIEKSGS